MKNPLRYKYRRISINNDWFAEIEILESAPHTVGIDLILVLKTKHGWPREHMVIRGYWETAPWEEAGVLGGIGMSLWQEYKKAREGAHRADIKVIEPWAEDRLLGNEPLTKG